MNTELKNYLDNLESLEKQATPAPWREGAENVWQDDLFIPVLHTRNRAFIENGVRKTVRSNDKLEWLQGDVALVAASRNALPKLLKMLRVAVEALESGQTIQFEGCSHQAIPTGAIEDTLAAITDLAKKGK